jgi:hypothetical protein
LVESWFRELTDKALGRDVFRSVPEPIEAYLPAHNNDPTAFVWTASADQILKRSGEAG